MFLCRIKCETKKDEYNYAALVNSTRESEFPKMELFVVYSCVSGKISQGKRCFLAPDPCGFFPLFVFNDKIAKYRLIVFIS